MSRPAIKLKIGTGTSFNAGIPPIGTPTPGGGTRIKLSFGGGTSKPPTPSELVPNTPQKTKAGRAPKPSAKIVANKNGKRTKDDSDDEKPLIDRAPKKIRLSMGGGGLKTPTVNVIKAKFKGKPPKRPLGEGYDSEASDRERDPAIEEEFILRMSPGDDCDYLRNAIEKKEIGMPLLQGGADVKMKFIHPDGRRAIVTIRGTHYAATLVDLPCVIEGMKSWDKKGWWKSADICQMLWVFAKIKNEAEAHTVELPKLVDPETFQYPHGLTAPMRNARKNRFRKRISRTAIEAVEDAVEKLLEADARAESIKNELVEPEGGSRFGSQMYGSPDPYGNDEDEDEFSVNGDADADGEVDDTNNYFSHKHSNGAPALDISIADDLDAEMLEAEMRAAFDAEHFDVETPSSNAIADTPDQTNGGTSDANGEMEEEDSGDESDDAEGEDDDDDADGESDDGVDEDEKTRLAQLQGAREDIAEMEKQLASLQASLQVQANPYLKKRIENNISKIKVELQLKKSSIGEGDDD